LGIAFGERIELRRERLVTAKSVCSMTSGSPILTNLTYDILRVRKALS
jgi:hypothetical protein